MQTTIDSVAAFAGTGLHSGRPVRLRVLPADAGTGILFVRTDLEAGTDAVVPALWDRVRVSPLNTRIENAAGVGVSTIEHLMAALAGTGIHNARIEIDGPEVPILDGSAAGFVREFLKVGRRSLAAPLDVIEILQPVEWRDGQGAARLDPSAGLVLSFAIDFPDAAIGRQTRTLDMANGAFVRELCDSRTFCRRADVDRMQANGLALGGTLWNAVVVDGAEVLSPGGLRHSDEPVRHKMLDALGDLATAGAPILGRYTGVRAGHSMTNGLLRALFARPEAWRWRRCDAGLAARLPGAGLGLSDLAAVA